MAHLERRIQKEIAALENDRNLSQYYSITHNPNNILSWSANIHCLPVQWHDGKDYELDIVLPPEYPIRPPTIRFLRSVNCECVSRTTGEMSLDILRGGPTGAWSPALTITGVIQSIISVLTDPAAKRYNRR
jgi:ubiquitin-protein ligase